MTLNSTASRLPKSYIKNTNPTSHNDRNSGYGLGDIWYNDATNITWICVDNSEGYAIWEMTTRSEGARSITSTTGPTIDNDVDAGYLVGDIWFDSALVRFYICTNNTAGAAIWTLLLTEGLVKHNVGNNAPTIADDSAHGYAIGSYWYDAVLGKEYVCVNANVNSAV